MLVEDPPSQIIEPLDNQLVIDWWRQYRTRAVFHTDNDTASLRCIAIGTPSEAVLIGDPTLDDIPRPLRTLAREEGFTLENPPPGYTPPTESGADVGADTTTPSPGSGGFR